MRREQNQQYNDQNGRFFKQNQIRKNKKEDQKTLIFFHSLELLHSRQSILQKYNFLIKYKLETMWSRNCCSQLKNKPQTTA